MRFPVDRQAIQMKQIFDLGHQRPQTARIEEIFHQESAGRPNVRQHRNTARNLVELSSRSSVRPQRRASATRWMKAFVEPPMAISTAIAFSNASQGQNVAKASSPPKPSRRSRSPQFIAMRMWFESGAGIEDAPGSVMPSASASAVMVEAVPIVMQKPGERAMPFSMLFQSSSVMCARATLGPELPEIGAAAQRLAVPVAAQHRAGGQINRRQIHADGAHQQAQALSCRSRPSGPRHPPADCAALLPCPSPAGCDTAWAGLHVRLGDRERRNFHREIRPPAKRLASPPRRARADAHGRD